MMELIQANHIAEGVVAALQPACERISRKA